MHPGELFADRYRLESRLGEGGMGIVFLALDERLGRRVAVKVMRPDVAADAGLRTRFALEAASAAGLEHPNVVAVHDYGEHDGQPYLVMSYVAGRDLGQELSAGPIGLARTVAIVAQTAAGLDAAHAAGHVHRDIKPANILLHTDASGRERALITDFGLVLSQTESHGLTGTGAVPGTLRYLSPEQLRGEQAGPRSDVYALACVSFECLTGRPPYTGATDVEVAHNHLTQPPESLRPLLQGVPPEVAAVVVRGLAKEPARRTASAGAFAEDLAAAARATGPPGAPTARGRHDTQVLDLRALGTQHPAPAPPSRRRGLALAATTIAAAFAVALGWGYLTADDDREGGRPTTPSPGATDAHTDLAARLPSSVFADCRPHPEREGPERPTALTCSSVRPGADELLVARWRDAEAMAADFAATHGAKPDGKCGQYTGEPASGIRSTWGDDAPLACYVNSQGAAILLWEYPERALQVLAVRRDRNAPALFDWWESAVRVPLLPQDAD